MTPASETLTLVQLVHRPQRRGAEIFARRLSEALAARGHQCVEVHLYRPPDEGGLIARPGDRCLEGEPSHFSERCPGFQPGLLRSLGEVLDDIGPDLVQANGGRTVKYGALARGRKPAPWTLLYRNIGDPEAWGRSALHRLFYRRWVWPRVDAVVGVSRSTLQTLHRLHEIAVPSVTIHPGIPLDELRPEESPARARRRWDTPETAPVLLAVGSLTSEKRPDRFLRVAAQVRQAHPDVHFWWAGAGPLAELMRARAQSLGLADRLRWLGAQERIATSLSAADVLLITSDTEGLPAVAVEAGALGLPVVASRVGGIAEAVLDGITGLLTEPGDEAALASAVEDLLADPGRARKLGEAARKHVERELSWDRTVDAYLTFYREMIRKHDHSRRPRSGESP